MAFQTDYTSIADMYDQYVVARFDIPFFVEEVRNLHGAVLELMAGTGRLSIPLVEAGAHLTAVDASERMLDIFARKLQEKHLRAEIVCSDVRTMRFETKFELALLGFNSFSELLTGGDRRTVLEAVSYSLMPGGRFLCTLHNPRLRRATIDGSLYLTGRFPAGDGSLLVSGMEQERDGMVERLQFLELYDREGRLESKRVLEMRFALIEREEFEDLAQEAGFAIERLYGNYDRTRFDPDASPFMIWTLKNIRG
jgi:SAM-dependent methyltransferase